MTFKIKTFEDPDSAHLNAFARKLNLPPAVEGFARDLMRAYDGVEEFRLSRGLDDGKMGNYYFWYRMRVLECAQSLSVINPASRDMTVVYPGPGVNFAEVVAATDASTYHLPEKCFSLEEPFGSIDSFYEASLGNILADFRHEVDESGPAVNHVFTGSFAGADGLRRERTVNLMNMDANDYVPDKPVDVIWDNGYFGLEMTGKWLPNLSERGFLVTVLPPTPDETRTLASMGIQPIRRLAERCGSPYAGGVDIIFKKGGRPDPEILGYIKLRGQE